MFLEFSLFTEDSAAHLKDRLESLTAFFRVLTESLDASFFDLVLNLLPSAAEGSDLGFLLEVGLGGWHGLRRLIYDSLTDVQDIRPRQVGRAHRDFPGHWIDVGYFIDMGRRTAAEEGENPLWC